VQSAAAWCKRRNEVRKDEATQRLKHIQAIHQDVINAGAFRRQAALAKGPSPGQSRAA
jgi:hypothetical protein